MKSLVELIWLTVTAVAAYFLISAVVVSYSCLKHGDVGPYPETDLLPWLVPLAIAVAVIIKRNGK